MQEKRTIIRKKINIYLLYYSVVMRERGFKPLFWIDSLFMLKCESVKVFLSKNTCIFTLFFIPLYPILFMYINKHVLYPEDTPKIPRR